MKLTLYKTLDADNVIGKTTQPNPEEITINLKADTDITNPVLVLAVVPGITFSDFNYCKIDELNRYYFIRSVDIINNKICKLHCECDYLQTYMNEILQCTGKIRKEIAAGDYGETLLEFTGEVDVTTFESDVELTPVDNSLLTVLRWG